MSGAIHAVLNGLNHIGIIVFGIYVVIFVILCLITIGVDVFN